MARADGASQNVSAFSRFRVSTLLAAAGGRLSALREVRRALGLPMALLVGVLALARETRVRTARFRPAPVVPAPTIPTACEHAVKDGILFVGYVEAKLGLGQSLRGVIEAAERAGLPFAILPYNHSVESRFAGPFKANRYDLKGRYRVNLLEVAPDQVANLRSAMGAERFTQSHTILRSYWELARIPSEWLTPLSGFDEIWAPSLFVREALGSRIDTPVFVMPPAVDVTIGQVTPRSTLGLKSDVFYFIFTFDLASYPKRKNPLGVIAAFQRAFPDRGQKVGLILKYARVPGLFEVYQVAIERAAAADQRIVLIRGDLSRDDFLSLLAASDAYVSLHRSEGLGLGMIEAMMLGRAVIGTDYSGCCEFLTSETGFPIRYRPVAVEKHDYPHATGQLWAEPDLTHAAEVMRTVFHCPDQVREIAKAGQTAVHARYGLSAVGAAMRSRVAAIDEGGSKSRSGSLTPTTSRISSH
jgi:glycosyltransferase involved in cell wall biosynthesis